MADQDPTISSVTGPTLRAVLDSGPVTLPRALQLVLALIDELRRCRDAGVFYHVLSPDDVIVQADDRITLPPQLHSPVTDPHAPYASPEVMGGAMPDERSAVWQVGILLLELLAGKPPWKTAASVEGPEEPLPSLRGVNPEIPEQLELAVYRMLDTDPDLRVGTLDEAGREIRERLCELQLSYAPASSVSTTLGAQPSAPSLASSPLFAAAPLIGRQSELAAIGRILVETPCRLLTLAGPGGVGKSHLAFEAAKDLTRFFSDGSYIVPLNPVHSPAFIPLAVASAVAFSIAGRRDPLEQVAGFLRQKSLLLVLDDFDQLLAGADVVSALLDRTQGLKVLVTSRQRLGLRCERVVDIHGLAVPSRDHDDDAAEYAAVQLFLEHARRLDTVQTAVECDIDSVARICRLLEGLPLGIEMAAGWTRVLSCAEIFSEIERDVSILTTSVRDVPEHHRSMVAVLSQSWRRLSDRERLALGRLSVFGHGFRREAAEHVGADLQLLGALTDKSLLSRDASGRYHLHELLRQFVGGELSRDPAVLHRARQIHAEYFARFVSERHRALHAQNAEVASEEIEEELANVRIGFEWVLEHLQLEALESYLYALHTFLHGQGWLAVDSQTLDRALGHLRGAADSDQNVSPVIRRLLGVALVLQGDTHQGLGKFGAARVLYEEGLEILRERGTSTELTMALLGLGENAGRQGLYEQASTFLDEALRRATDVGDQRLLADCYDGMGTIAMYRSEYAAAQEWHAKCLSLLGESGDRRTTARALNNLGNASYCLGDMMRAREHYRAALEVNREIGSRRGIRTALGNLGNASISLDDHAAALQCYRQSLEVAREMGDEHGIAHSLYQLGAAESAAGNQEEAKRLSLESLEIHERTGERRGKGLALSLRGQACHALGETAQAVASANAAVELFRELGERWGFCAALEVAGDAHRAAGSTRDAIQAYTEGLRIAIEIGARALILGYTNRFARIMKEHGACENAALLHAFVLVSSDTESKTRREASEALKALESQIGADALEAATARAQSITPESLMAEIETRIEALSIARSPHTP